MDISDSPEESTFRVTVRQFIEDNLHSLVSSRGASADNVDTLKHAQSVLYSGGLVGVTWPKEYGGAGGTVVQQLIINEELDRAQAPRLIGWMGVGLCGPAIITHGTGEQKSRYLTNILTGEEIWCQLFSEPGAGSDLAAVATKAVPTEDGWVLRGQKVWNTGAHWSDYGVALARTGSPEDRHRGLTAFVVDMSAPGVTVRPLREMTGHAAFNEVFLEDVELPANAVLGEVGQGWAVALTMLMNERFVVGGDGSTYGAGPGALTSEVRKALPQLSESSRELVLQEYAACWIEALACRMTGNRLISRVSQGGEPGPEGSVGKLALGALLKRVGSLGLSLQGETAVFAAAPDGTNHWQNVAMFAPGLSLAGGTPEVMKNILGERILGLPPEPRVTASPALTTSPTASRDGA
ncbi:acyl-CoA dehydrogenase family protein [Rhodococcus pseudokoreensis]|uniref:Acyl-CoA dehydrogenase family protein n=1 Tax=Rhodococcus pseudokoreensis TaxID=2811421 RepID=A0A974ZUD0_9NOCA|nr:acyl-CoA dehydrogenase family protein [Rhodococcus pseudokoreensis]QSE90775.1 acyl-CoA dehydrogenase family protein [Rhodococcus pseudokoreensis]